jgi:catechol 2,3-dioxygenase-like lactoylglutathione lyase family enzyme
MAHTWSSLLKDIDMIKQLKFVSIPTRDQARAVSFYTEQLGFEVATDQPFNDRQRLRRHS